MNAMNHNDRYPGARPFADTEHDRQLFFGREQEINALLYQVLSVHLLILYGKSGLGKTSLLQAGVFPRLREQNFLPLPVRLNRPELPLMTVFADEINKTCSDLGVDYTPGETAGLWEFFKTAVFWCGDNAQTPVLVLDQFEEIFTLQSVDNRRWLARELGDLIGGRLPQRVRERLQRGEELPYSEKPPAVKIILSLREDYLGALQELTSEAPQILNDCFRLKPLNRTQARLAVVKPAQMEAGFSTRSFVYEDEAVEEMLTFLGGKSGEIEPFQLQVLCRQVEQKVQQEQAKGKQDIRVERAYLGGRKAMEKILQNFYMDAIGRLPKRRLRNRARLLCEEGLLSPEGYRVSLVENNIKKMYKLRPPALQTLVDARLLRKEERLESYYYELSHDSLAQPIANSRRWRMPRGLKIGLGVTGVILLTLGGVLYVIWDAQIREIEKYYDTFEKRWGRPFGIGELTPEQIKHRAVSLKFVQYGRDNPVETVMAVNGYGECTPNHNIGTYFKPVLGQTDPLRECQWKFIYDSQGQVVYEKAYNKHNKMVWGFIYSLSTEKDQKNGYYVGSDGFPRPQSQSPAEFVEFTYSPEGNEILRRYFDRYHNPQQGPDKEFSRWQDFYPNGLIQQITSRDLADRPMIDNAGNARLKIEYDNFGNVSNAIALDTQGQPILVKDGFSKFVAKYDQYGNQIEWKYLDVNNDPILNNEGFHKGVATYDEHGNQDYVTYFGVSDPILTKSGFHSQKTIYDSHGNPIEWTFLDIHDKPTLHKNGYHMVKAVYDELGNIKEWRCFDTYEKPTLDKSSNSHKMIAQYDDHGNKTEAYFDINDQPTLHKDGYHIIKTIYDDHGNKIEQSYYDVYNKPSMDQLHKIHKIRTQYNEYGKSIEESYFNIDDQPSLEKNGYHLVKAEYDNRGNQTELSYYNTFNEPVINQSDGTHKMTAKYNDRGNPVEVAYFDTTAHPTQHKDGYHKYLAKYDERGNPIEWAYFDTAGQPIQYNGYHRSTAKYNERGKQIEWAYFDATRQPTQHGDGYQRSTAKYDERGNPIEWSYFNSINRPVLHKDGYHRSTAMYDENDNPTEWAYFDADNQPILLKEGSYLNTIKYDERGNPIEQACFDTARQAILNKYGYHKKTQAYDLRANVIEERYFGVNNEPVLYQHQYHKATATYDNQGNRLGSAIFDETGKPVLATNGCHRWTAKYDKRGNRVEEACFDANGNPTLDKSDGTHKMVTRYDEYDNEIERSYYGVDGELTASSKAGFKKQLRIYYPNGQKAEEVVVGLDGSKGFTKQVTRYDEAGREVYQGFFDDQDKPAHTNESYGKNFGFTEIAVEYNVEGKPKLMRFSGLKSDSNNYDSMVVTFNNQGKPEETAYFDALSKPALHEDGYHKFINKYDERGNLTEWAYFDNDGKPAIDQSDGTHRMTARYDERGQRIEEAYYGPGEPTASKEGYHKRLLRYYYDGKEAEETLISLDNSKGFTKQITRYGEAGKEVYQGFFDEQHKPAHTNKNYGKNFGFSEIITEYASTDKIKLLRFLGFKSSTNNYDSKVVTFNSQGKPEETAYFDPLGKPALHEDGYHRLTSQYDERGNQTEWAYFDTDGRPTLHQDGYHRSTAKYDERGNQIEWAYFDTEGKPTLDQSDRTHKMTARYDERGNRIEEAFYGVDGEPTASKEGFKKRLRHYYPNGKKAEEIFIGLDGSKGFTKQVTRYDEAGREIYKGFFDDRDRPAHTNKNYGENFGFSEIVVEYTSTDEIKSIRFLGLKLDTNSYDSKLVIFNGQKKPEEIAYFDTLGKPALHEDGHHRFTAKYDEHGNQTEWAYFDTTGQPTLHKDGYHRSTAKYDERGNKVEWAYFDVTDRPMMLKDGYHRSTAKYDERGNQIESAYFDTDGKPTLDKTNGAHKISARYDERGNGIEWAYFDITDRPMMLKDGYHRSTAKYDEHGNQTEWAYFDTTGQPTLHKDGYHRSTAKYDEHGNKVEWAYFDVTDRPMMLKDGYHRSTAKYDERGNRTEWAYFGIQGEPLIDQSDGTHKMTARYDERDNRIEEEFFGVDEEPTASKEGFKKRLRRYYSNGEKAEEIIIGLDGSEGFDKKITRYDEEGREIYQGFFDDQDKPAYTNDRFAAQFGYSEKVSEYAVDGKLIAIRFSGFKPYWGYAKMVINFDENGDPISSSYFDNNDQPIETEIVVTTISPDGSAGKIGIQNGDVFIDYDGRPIKDFLKFIIQRQAESQDGPAKELHVRRNGKILSFWLQPGKIGVGLQGRGINTTATNSN